MSDDNGMLRQQVQTLEPLFKTEEKEEQLTQNQDKFIQQDQFQEVTKETTEEKQTSLEENLANSFVEADKTQIKADNSDPQEPQPAYVSLHATNLAVTKSDSKKMAAVKDAVKKYQDSRGTDDERSMLEAVIKACNSYTWGKFSLFSFGKSKVMLNEVKALRQQAQEQIMKLEANSLVRIKEIQEEEKRLSEERAKREAEEAAEKERERIKEEEEEKAREAELAEIKEREKEEEAIRTRKNVAKLFSGEIKEGEDWPAFKIERLKVKGESLRAKELVKKYPTMTDETARKIASTEFEDLKFLDDKTIENDYLAKQAAPRKVEKKKEPAPEPKPAETREVEKKSEPAPEPEQETEKKEKEKSEKKSYNKDFDWVDGFGFGDMESDVEREFQRRLNNRNAFQKLYHKLLGNYELKIQVMQDWLKVYKFANDIRDDRGPMLSKNDTDYESTFI